MESLARNRLRRLGITDERMDGLTYRQASVEILVAEVTQSLASERAEQQAWLARSIQDAPIIPVKVLKEPEVLDG